MSRLAATADVARVEAPVTLKAYLLCAFASVGGIFFGYDIGYISSVMGMKYFIHQFAGLPYPDPNDATAVKAFALSGSDKSLITSILSAGTFFGAIIAGDLSDWIGRRRTIILGCFIFAIGVILSVASTSVALLSVGRFIAGLGVGFESSVTILYMSEVAPKKVRGAIVAAYQFCITIGIMTASCVDYGTESYLNSASYRIPIAIQFIWAIILGGGLFFLPESPRFFVHKGKTEEAAHALSRIRGQPKESEFIQAELAEIVANHEYELSVVPQSSYWASWANCFTGSLWHQSSNLRRTILGASLQMMQQWTGVNFIFYFGTTFFQHLGTIQNPFLLGMITTIVNVLCTPVSFYLIEKFGRRPMLIYGALGMLICQFVVAIVGTIITDTSNNAATSAMIAFICLAIACFASTWGPVAWALIGEIFPLPIRSRAIGLSTSSNWLWNTIIAVITPYLVDEKYANLGPKVFYLWGSLCTCACVYAYFLVPETKGLTLEQVDKMMEETTPRTSAGWRPHTTFAAEMGMADEANVHGEVVMVDPEKGPKY